MLFAFLLILMLDNVKYIKRQNPITDEPWSTIWTRGLTSFA
jgi:hypothetical protein